MPIDEFIEYVLSGYKAMRMLSFPFDERGGGAGLPIECLLK